MYGDNCSFFAIPYIYISSHTSNCNSQKDSQPLQSGFNSCYFAIACVLLTGADIVNGIDFESITSLAKHTSLAEYNFSEYFTSLAEYNFSSWLPNLGSSSGIEVPKLDNPYFKFIDAKRLTESVSNSAGISPHIFNPHPWPSLSPYSIIFNKVIACRYLILPLMVCLWSNYLAAEEQSLKVYTERLEKFIEELIDNSSILFKSIINIVNEAGLKKSKNLLTVPEKSNLKGKLSYFSDIGKKNFFLGSVPSHLRNLTVFMNNVFPTRKEDYPSGIPYSNISTAELIGVRNAVGRLLTSLGLDLRSAWENLSDDTKRFVRAGGRFSAGYFILPPMSNPALTQQYLNLESRYREITRRTDHALLMLGVLNRIEDLLHSFDPVEVLISWTLPPFTFYPHSYLGFEFYTSTQRHHSLTSSLYLNWGHLISSNGSVILTVEISTGQVPILNINTLRSAIRYFFRFSI